MRLSFKLTVMDFWHRSIQPGLETEIPSIHPSLRPTLLVPTAPQLGARRRRRAYPSPWGDARRRCSSRASRRSSPRRTPARAVASSVIRGGLDPPATGVLPGPRGSGGRVWIAQPGSSGWSSRGGVAAGAPVDRADLLGAPRVRLSQPSPRRSALLVNLAKATAGGSKRATVADARAAGRSVPQRTDPARSFSATTIPSSRASRSEYPCSP